MATPAANPSSGWHPGWLWLLAALSLGGAFYDMAWAHPGLAVPDEWAGLNLLQAWREGAALPWILGMGCLTRWAQAFCIVALPNLAGLHLPTLLALGLECVLLYRLAHAQFGRRAAMLAVAFDLATPFFWMRARTVMNYATLPAELLFFAWLIPRLQRNWEVLLLGLAAGLFLFEYEAWILALPVLGIFFLARTPPAKGFRWAAGLGLLLGSLLVSAASSGALASYATKRWHAHLDAPAAALAGNFASNLAAFFWGGPAHTSLGLGPLGVLPRWALPLVLLGFFARRDGSPKMVRWLGLWAALGCLPLVLNSEALEPNRLIVAWPAFCLLAALGLEKILALPALRFRGRGTALLMAWAGLAALGFHGYLRAMDNTDERTYAYSRRIRAAAEWLSARAPGRVLAGLGSRPNPAFRFFLRQPARPGGPVWALIPWTYAPPLPDPAWGDWKEFAAPAGVPPVLLLRPSAALLPQLERSDAFLSRLAAALPPGNDRAALGMLQATGLHDGDPWVRTACLEYAFQYLQALGEMSPAFCAGLDAENGLRSATVLLASAAWLAPGNAGLALRLADKGRRLDPRRRQAWNLELSLLLNSGRAAQAGALEKEMRDKQSFITVSQE